MRKLVSLLSSIHFSQIYHFSLTGVPVNSRVSTKIQQLLNTLKRPKRPPLKEFFVDDSEEIVEGSSQGQSMHPSAVRTGRPGRGLLSLRRSPRVILLLGLRQKGLERQTEGLEFSAVLVCVQ